MTASIIRSPSLDLFRQADTASRRYARTLQFMLQQIQRTHRDGAMHRQFLMDVLGTIPATRSGLIHV